MNEWDARTRLLLGEAGRERLRSSHVLIVGLGGVGSFAAESLARAGVGALTLVDGDRVEPSNLNRQLIALRSTLGQPKVAVMARRIADINPACRLTLVPDFIEPEGVSGLLAPGYELVLDAIDTFSAKVALLATALKRGQPILSSMGAGGRLDPTRVQVGDLMDTRVCPLARAVRLALRKQGIGRGLTVVWSDEPPLSGIIARTGAQGPRAMRGTISFLPALFGLMLAGVAIRHLLAAPVNSAHS
ncbi:tRNA threonylcarbamoyladenosine dehydratase [Caldichromatium japonicum]|uniref:tRNA threonylcarbamoyladenosine dehydratase n=1 Tax=Caldichromatium japonicum TaxID=2699430 RepID=A0A6G7VEA4_9GAMM|nr:tRNA threonylcarbamoyladenosine dehydratase [Caldichromatium japonicum]QIK38196.1 tRNA threonylcarbamoyladenosine dehydratase [Caldichromatium japonicum]